MAGYRVYVDGVPVTSGVAFTPVNSARTTAETSFTLTGLEPHTAYRITVEAGDGANKWTGSGPAVTVRTR